MLAAVAAAGLAFQVVHLLEHLLQAGYWFAHPTQSPWLTPWATAGRDLLAGPVGGHAGGGNELLHLAGNLVFLAALVAAVPVARHRGGRQTHTWLRRAVLLQAVHVAEHVVLTWTSLAWGQARGVTTLGWLLQPGTVEADAFRVWLHLAINAAATACALLALTPRGVSPRAAVSPLSGPD